MKDRIPKYAGRVKLTPVANQPNVYDMVRADEPLQEGTPLNKATLLDDETAASLGLTGDSNVNDAFGALSRNIADITGKFNNRILKIDNGGTGADNANDARENLGIAKIYIGEYQGTGTKTLELALPYIPKAILLMGDPGQFEIIQVENISSSVRYTIPVTMYKSNVGQVGYNEVIVDRTSISLKIYGTNTALAFNDKLIHTYILFG